MPTWLIWVLGGIAAYLGLLVIGLIGCSLTS